MAPKRATRAATSLLVVSGILSSSLFAACPAWAQQSEMVHKLEGAPAARSKRSKRSASIVLPSGHVDVAGEWAFLTSARSPLGQRLGFTDVALLRLNLRRSFADWFELYGGGELLTKQPTATHAPLFQGAHLAAQAEYAEGFGASLGAALGPLVGADGVYYLGGPGLSWKPIVGKYMRFALGLGNTWTFLDFEGETQESFWLGEAVAHAETQIGDEKASMWVGIDYAVPFAKSPGSAAPDPERGYLDPQVRMNFEVGGALGVGVEDWSVYAVYVNIDRGEPAKPETTLPILDGGFDQQQLIVGVEYRFTPKTHDSPDAYDHGY